MKSATLAILLTLCTQTAFAKEPKTPHVTGIGGVFFKAKGDPKTLAAWYEENLGIKLEPYGAAIFKWPQDTAEDKGVTVWRVADKSSDWFSPSESTFMINYRVDDMVGLIGKLRHAGVKILKGPESHENGKFSWIMDPEGNKIELWEPKIWDERN